MKFDELLTKKNKLNEILKNSNNSEKYDIGLKEGIKISFDLFNKSIEFYLKYKDNVKLLMKEQNKLWSKWVSYYNDQNNIDNSNYISSYNKWLFDNIFINIQHDEKRKLLELY
jgi:hypothetical protein